MENHQNNSTVFFGKDMLEMSNQKLEKLKKEAIVADSMIRGKYFQVWYADIIKMPIGDEKKSELLNFILGLYQACSSVCLINTPAIIESLHADDLLTDDETKWIITSSELLETFREIKENNNYQIFEPDIIFLLQQYLSARLFVVLVERFRIYFLQSSSSSEYDLWIQNLRNNRKRKVKKNLSDKYIDELAEFFEPMIKELFNDQKYTLVTLFTNAKSRKFDDMLLPIYSNFCLKIQNEDESIKIKKNEKLILMYPLFALIMKERDWKIERFEIGDKKGAIDYRAIEQRMRKFIFKQ